MTSAEVLALGDGHPESASAQGGLVLSMLHKYSSTISASLAGNAEDMSTTELMGGSRINFILREIFVKGLNALDPTAVLSDDDIRTAIQNSAGAKSILLIPEEPFELLAKQSISKLLEPCKRCAALVHEELMRLVRRCIGSDVRHYPNFARVLEEEARNYLDEGAHPAESMIVSLVQCQLSYINTSDPGFVGGTQAIAQAQEEIKRLRAQQLVEVRHSVSEDEDSERPPLVSKSTNKEGKLSRSKESKAGQGRQGLHLSGHTASTLLKGGSLPDSFSMDENGLMLHEPPSVLRATEPETDEEIMQVKVTRILLRSYFAIVRSSLLDTVPKAVMHFLVNSVRTGLQQHLIRTLYRDDLFAELLREAPELAQHRRYLRERLSALNQAVDALSGVEGELRT